MHYKHPTYQVEPTPEFLAHEKGLVTISHTIIPDGIEPNELGHKIAVKGSYIDSTGKVLNPTFTADSATFDSDPIGILFSSVDVTYGNADGAIMYKGTVQGDFMNWGDQEWSEALGKSVHEKLPNIDFTDKKGTLITGIPAGSGGGGGGSSVSFPITVAQGGTGATDAETARTNLEIDSKTNTDATKATAEAAKATAEQNKTDIQSLTERVTTLEG